MSISLDAVIVAVTDDQPRLLLVEGLAAGGTDPAALPSAPLDAAGDSTLELGLRRCVREQSGLELGYAEQLYTFGDRERGDGDRERPLAIAYLALVHESPPLAGARWLGVYDLFPWEDHRDGVPPVLDDVVRPRLAGWAEAERGRVDRVQVAFGPPWDGIRVLERYELLYEAGLVAEHALDQGRPPRDTIGTPLQADHRRIAAVALARLRGKLTYRPLVFELLPERFTLLELQRTVEALAGVRLHKQNFRRLVERSRLVEGTGERADSRGGRPAELFRYRPEVQLERPRPGVGQPYR